MKSDFIVAIAQLSAEKNLPKEVVLEAVEQALVSAYKRDTVSSNANISVRIQPHTGEVRVYAQKSVVEEPADPWLEIGLDEARRINAQARLGEVVDVELPTLVAGRIAAQTAKQVVLQRLRDAEREVVFEEFAGKEGDIVSGVVQRVDARQVVIELGRSEAILPAAEQSPNEFYRPGQRIKVFLMEVHRTLRGPQVVVSRTHRNLLRRLFELEVPEIGNGLVELRAIAREPGHRSKVAVAGRQEGIDPVGACVGMRGIRIQNIVNELHGEKVDVVLWHPDATQFVANALGPAQVLSVDVSPGSNTARVVVPDRQLSLAIGKDGQNARLAAKLTGLRIDIRSASSAEAEKAELAMRLESISTAELSLSEPLLAEVSPDEEPLMAVAPVVAPVPEREEVALAVAEAPEVVPVVEALVEPIAVLETLEEAAPKSRPLEQLLTPAVERPTTIRFAEEILPRLESETKKTKTGRPEMEPEERKKGRKGGRRSFLAEEEAIEELQELEEFQFDELDFTRRR